MGKVPPSEQKIERRMENRVDLYKLRAALAEFQKVDPDLTVSDALAFLVTAEDEGLSVKDVQNRLQLTQSTASRTVNKLGQHGTRSKAGLALLQTDPNPGERRKVQVRLSARGRAFAKLLAGMVAVFALVDPDGPGGEDILLQPGDPTTPGIYSAQPMHASAETGKAANARHIAMAAVNVA